ncbi:hypothetical protein C5N14_04500 [Micromonospora sp. MW-13]|uniref:hypothetical protein n=1 Tax=Micromonospora sp. MW-13 TaxID=2094022 RepID=UPI000E44E1CD|nr:hypothetical protein [Micromonospora sp. MW-13]RGC69666.1 hypothetical protein C5N14_04500 [Micromonospora sp. MW-13]
MSELSLLVEPAAAVSAERVDELAHGLAEDLRTVRGLRVAHAQSPVTTHGKSQQAWELGMLVVGGVFSATTMRTIALIAVAYADRAKARSIRLRRGDGELVISGSTKVDEALVTQLAALLGADPGAGASAAALPPGATAGAAALPPGSADGAGAARGGSPRG